VIGSSGSFCLDTGVVKDSVQYQLCRLLHQNNRPPEQRIKAQQPYRVTVHTIVSRSVQARGAIGPTCAIRQRYTHRTLFAPENADPSGDTNSTLHKIYHVWYTEPASLTQNLHTSAQKKNPYYLMIPPLLYRIRNYNAYATAVDTRPANPL
jgi:hypothetical protein